MAEVVVLYGPPGTGKTRATLRLAELLAARGLRVGGFFQRATGDERDRRNYDLVRFRDQAEAVALARPGVRRDEGTESAVCSLVFAKDALATGLLWLREDAAWANVLVIDEVSKLEVAGDGHCEALRWALALPADMLLLLSVRADQLTYAVERFELVDRIRGYLELPAVDAQLQDLAARLSVQG
jgi:nucleoside-triphosphatase THEP1